LHAGSVADIEEDIIAAGAQLIWVLEQTALGGSPDADDCRSAMDFLGSDDGWCVGDGQTQPTPGTFDNSPFSVARGFDMIVERETMVIVWEASHGTGGGQDNPSAAEVLAAVEAAVAAAP
jgi:hypothetical protein